MKFLLILLILCFMLLPLAKLRLRPAQKKTAQLRQHAIENGMQVKFAATPALQKPLSSQQSIRYQLLLTPAEQKSLRHLGNLQWVKNSPESNASWQLKPDNAALHNMQPSISSALNNMPNSINAVELNSEHLGAYWYEEGELQDVAQIAMALRQLREALNTKKPADTLLDDSDLNSFNTAESSSTVDSSE